MSKAGYAGVAIVGVSILCAGVGIGMFMAPINAPQSVAGASDTSTVSVEPIHFDDPRQVTLVPSTAAGTSLSVMRGGVVTSLNCLPGQIANSGEVALSIDETPVPYLSLRIPLWRTLSVGARGDDVRSLQEALLAEGYKLSADGTYGKTTASAVSEFKKRLGMTEPLDSISPSDIVWLSGAPIEIASCSIQLGQTLTGSTEIAETEPTVLSVSVEGLSEVKAEGPRTLRFESATVTLKDGIDQVTDKTFLASLLSSGQYASWQQSNGDAKITATILLDSPIEAYVIPPSALIGNSGKACVVTDDSVVPVTVLTSTLGRVVVESDHRLKTVTAPVSSSQVCP